MNFLFGWELGLNISIGLDLLLTLTNSFDRAKNLTRIKSWTFAIKVYHVAAIVMVNLFAVFRFSHWDPAKLEDYYPLNRGIKVNLAYNHLIFVLPIMVVSIVVHLLACFQVLKMLVTSRKEGEKIHSILVKQIIYLSYIVIFTGPIEVYMLISLPQRYL